MVFKVSKGGVRSGNTLRGLRCLRNKRYSRQGCILVRSSLPPTELTDLLDSSGADDSMSASLGATDTILSMNKKGRWQLPVTLHDMIKTDKFSSEKTVVSLLERHKLKRTSNCVSFICNLGKIRHVVPKQKRYFSFNLEKAGTEQSNRQRKHAKAEVAKAMKTPQIKFRRTKQSGVMKTVDLFTISGFDNTETPKNQENPKKFYRLEVYYPCPKTCSLVYNPKYTDVQDMNEEEKTPQVNPNIKASRAKRKHRKKISSKDMEELYEDTTENYEDEFSDNDDLDDGDPNCDEDNCGTYLESVSRVGTGIALVNSQIPDSSAIFAKLITEAEKAKSLCDRQGRLGGRRPPRGSAQGQEKLCDKEHKSHLVYIDREHKVTPPAVTPPQEQSMPGLYPARVIMDSARVIMDSARVIMDSAEVDPERLRTKYGGYYAEADSAPRRFVINVTDDVQNVISSYKNTDNNTLYTSFLVFIHDGFYDDGLEIFNVIFNSNICTDTLKINENIPFEHMSVEDIMNRVVCSLLDMKQENQLSMNKDGPCEFLSKPTLSFLYEALSIKIKTFHAHDEISRVSLAGVMQEKISWSCSLSNVIDNMDFDMFCDICYANINQSQVGSASSTQLSRCGHRFCDDCWRLHFRGQFKEGAAKMACAGYDCNVIVGPVTLLSLLHVSEVSQLFQRVCEEDAQASPDCRWCPNPSCGRIVKLDNGNSINFSRDIKCACGHEFCFLCLSQPHWPATCEQAEAYTESLPTLSPPKEEDDDLPSTTVTVQKTPKSKKKNNFLEVEGRICPKCSRFIEKRFGCPHISCKCGNQFCWNCLKQWAYHVCKPNSSIVFEYTRRLRIKHIVGPSSGVPVTSLASPSNSETRRPKPRQKITLSQRALQQRLESTAAPGYKQNREMVCKIVRMSNRDLIYKRELLSLLHVETDGMDNEHLPSVAPHVTKFLRSCVDIQRALHHVAEFTFVLLQELPDSMDRKRIFRLANDLSGYCSFIRSILELGQNQDVKAAVRRLLDIQQWARRALVILMSSVNLVRS